MDTARVPGRTQGRSFGTRLYASLLRAYPPEFRRRYADQMVLLFADQLRDARRGLPALARVWVRTLVDIASSAAAEHLRRDRTVAQSLATFQPTRTMRLAGLVAVLGGALLLWAFISWNPFDDRHVNTVRLMLFWAAGIVVALAFHGRQAADHRRVAIVATAAVVAFDAWNEVWLVLAWDRDSPFIGSFGFAGFVASSLGWLATATYGAATLATRAAWRGMGRLSAMATRLGAMLLLAGPIAMLGIDRFGLTHSEPYGEMFTTVALIGVGAVGLGWLLLGGVLLVGGRGQGAAPAS